MSIMKDKSARGRILLAASFAALMFTAAAPVAMAQPAPTQQQMPAAPAAAQQGQPAQMQDEVRAVLTQYGRFEQHPRYGEVWVPTVTPQGWKPYAACGWVNTRQFGWYYDDKTPWGQIVHHYGRWAHDAQMGWIWTPGAEFSPGWVVWRSSPEWTGWAPMMPDEDVQGTAATDFNTAAFWTFVQTKRFAQGCDATAAAPAAQVPAILTSTTYVTDIQLVGGITVFVLPGYVFGPVIDISIGFAPWPTWFLAQTLIDWNFVWNNLVVINQVVFQPCPPNLPPIMPVMPPPKQVNLPPLPPQAPPPVQMPPPPQLIPPQLPPVVQLPPKGPPQGVPPIFCPIGTKWNGQACKLIDTCGPGQIHTPQGCVPVVVNQPPPKWGNINPNSPCGMLGGPAFLACLKKLPPNIPANQQTGPKKPLPGPDPGLKQAGPGTGPVGGNVAVVDPRLKNPNVIFHPNLVQQKPVPAPNKLVAPPTYNKLPNAMVAPVRPNPNPVVLGPGSAGVSKLNVGGSAPANGAPAARRTLPVMMQRQGSMQRGFGGVYVR